MNFLIHLLEFLIGAASVIAWVTVLGIVFSKFVPEKIYKKKLDLQDCIAMAGIGLFSTLFTLFFLFIAPKIGLARVDLASIFGNLVSGGHAGALTKWGGRLSIVTLGVLGSYSYAFLVFKRGQLGKNIKGLLFGLVFFVLGSFLVFPLLSHIPAVQLTNLSVPSLFGPLAGDMDQVLTFLAAMIVFGGLLANIYSGWDEV